jgi:23S rRNA (cytidine2498-2'-O)-methyltransferase
MNKVVLYCRPGFEKECAAEITDKASRLEVFGFARVKDDSGYVIFECYQAEDGEKLVRELPFSSLVFARQMFVVGELLRDLPPEDRISPIVGMLQGVVEKGGELRVEVADTNESKELMKFCRKFTVPLRAALREAGVLTNYETPKRPVVHVFFIAPGCCYTGYSLSNNNSPFYMGIPRLKFPSDAPSRSTLKLEEAFHVFIPADEWDERLANGMYAVDLGASRRLDLSAGETQHVGLLGG